jgi:hypothetical protein
LTEEVGLDDLVLIDRAALDAARRLGLLEPTAIALVEEAFDELIRVLSRGGAARVCR